MNYKIGILNIGVNNLKSLIFFFNKFGKTIIIDKNSVAHDLKNIDLLILPGNGNFSFGSDHLYKNNMIDEIKNFKRLFSVLLKFTFYILISKN